MALLEDQIEEAQAAFVAAHEAGDTEGAQVLADHLRSLEAQKAVVDQAVTESSQAGTDIRNPLKAAGAGALIGAVVNPLRGAAHDVITPPKISTTNAQTITPENTTIRSNRTPYNPRGSSVEESIENWSNYADAQTEKARGVRRDTALLKKYPNMQLGPLGAASTPTPEPIPPAPPTMGEKGKGLLKGFVADHQPNTPFSIVKGGTRGAITGGALADIPQQALQGNYGTAAADLGIGAGNIIHGLARTKKGKALGSLLGIGSGSTRAIQGVNELIPEEQKATGGLVHLAGGGVANALTQTAINAPFIAPTASGIAKNVGKGAYAPAIEDAASLGLAMAPLNPLTVILSLMSPSEAGVGSTIDEWNAKKAEEEAARQRAQKQFEHEEFMRTKVGANAPKLFDQYLAEKTKPHMAAGGAAKEALKLAKKAFAPKQTQVLRASEALGPHEGKWLNITQSDRMRSTEGDLGGPGFSKFQLEHPDYAAAQAAWGVGNQPTASRIINVNKKFPEGQAIWTPMIGSETQHHSNQHVFDALTQEFNRQVAAGKLTPELRQRINQKLALAANKEGKPLFAEGTDIANPEHLQNIGSTFERRSNVANLLAGNTVGGQKGRIIDYPGIMQEMTDPMTVGAPTHALGTRLFTLNNQIENRPELHSAFPFILKGEDQGVAFAPVPKELGIQDWIQQFREFKGREPGFMDLTRNAPSQQITDKYLRSLEAAGHASGGKVGAAKKLFEEAQAAYKAKFTPGFYHGSPSNKIKAFDPEHNPSLDSSYGKEANATFLTKDPSFANSFLPDGNLNPYRTGSTVYPVSANLGKHFDHETPEGKAAINEYLSQIYPIKPELTDAQLKAVMSDRAQEFKDLKRGSWEAVENPAFQDFLRKNKYDSFATVEAGRKNVGIFKPENIRGKFAEFNPEEAANPDFMKAAGGSVQHFQAGKRVLSSGLEALQNMIKAEGRTPVVPVPNRWFAQPEKFPHVQGMVNKTLENSQLPREAFHSGAFIDPRTGQILDKNIYNDVGVLIDPNTGRPMMSAGAQSGIDILDPKTGSYTKSNLVRQSLFKPTGGDPMLGEMPFIATIEKGGMGHKYGLGTEYATPTEMYNTMTGANPTLRPRSRGDVFGMGDVVGQVQVGGRGLPHDVYEKLFVAPKGSDVPGVKLNKATGGAVEGYAPGGKVGALTELMQLIKQQGGTAAVKRLERAADLVPNLENKFQPQALKSAFTGDNASAVMVMRPGDFEKYAMPIDPTHKGYKLGDVYAGNHNELPKGDLDEYLNYLNSVKESGGFRSVPFLNVGQLQGHSFPNIQGHEGRHRMRALEKANEENALVQMIPTPNLREPFPRRSQEEYLDALQNKIGIKPMVRPEQTEEGISRGLIDLPEMFAAGGKVGAIGAFLKNVFPTAEREANKAAFLEGSKVTEPVFHMAKTGSPLVFDPKYKTELSSHGYHFGTSEQANFRQGQYDFSGDSPAMGKYHLSIKNPLEVSHMESYAPDHLAERMMDLGLLSPEKYDALSIKHNYDSVPIGSELVKVLKKNKYDGLVYQNEKEGAGLSFVPFEPTQIKSAIGNTGTFDPMHPDITKKKGGLV